MKNKLLLLFTLSVLILVSSCSKDDDEIIPESELSEYNLDIISYFKDVALGFEDGNSSNIIRKWKSPMKIYLDENPSSSINTKVEQTVNEINELSTDGFLIEIVNDANLSNCYIFLGQLQISLKNS
ncbi:MAG: hypothetical protein A2041_09535 [Bacteroidetes bacterium GWA2_31_9b]|nr:MAG: hypothetical protein A2041_09535 [Bacteroidetes bacterium GWA2_31_9b]